MKKLLCIFSLLVSVAAFADDTCEYRALAREFKDNCGGINEELQKMKKLGIANVAVTGVGTGAATGAVAAGVKKKQYDKLAEEALKTLDNIKNLSDAEFVQMMKNIALYKERKQQHDDICQLKRNYQAHAKRLGNLRTGLMVGNTATAVVGTALSAKNMNESKTVQERIQICLDTIQNNQQRISQAIFYCDQKQQQKLKEVVSNCRTLSTEHMEKSEKQNRASTIVSGVNIGTGVAGTITSAMGNKKEYDNKTKNINTAANVLAGTSAAVSGVSTVLNATTLKAINNNIKASELCEEALKKL